MIRYFIKKVVIFLFSILVIFILVFFLFYAIEHVPEKRSVYDYAFLGHSHVVCSVNPSKLSGKNKSVLVRGKNGQSLFWTVQTAEKLLIKNKVKVLFLCYTNNSLTTDEWAYSNDRLMNGNSLYQLTSDELLYLFKNNPWKMVKYVLSLPLPTGTINGEFNPKRNSIVKNEIKNNGERLKNQYHILKEYKTLEGFKRLINFCKVNPMQKIILVRFPLSEPYFSILGKNSNDSLFLASVHELTSLPNVMWKDYSRLIYEDSLFNNLDHLNLRGANVFSDSLFNMMSSQSYFNK